MNTKHILIATVLAGAFAPAVSFAFVQDLQPGIEFHVAFNGDDGDDQGSAGERKEVREFNIVRAEGMDQMLMNGRMMLPFGKVVKNAPYSAEVVSEQLQNLADGNQIAKKHTSMSYRDGSGRTRQEMRNSSGAVTRVMIVDPNEGTHITLNPETKTATKSKFQHVFHVGGDKSAVREELRKERVEMRKELAEARKEAGAAREQMIIKRIERADGPAGERLHENVRIHVMKGLEGRAMPGLERLGELRPMIAGAFGDHKWASKATTRDLGTKDIEGVKAQGKMRSYEIPAGEIGNRNPIVVSNETWYSPDLQVTVMSKRSDPRSGDKIYRLAGLKRDEPAAALFAIPSDYTVREAPAHVRKFEKRIGEKKMEEKK